MSQIMENDGETNSGGAAGEAAFEGGEGSGRPGVADKAAASKGTADGRKLQREAPPRKIAHKIGGWFLSACAAGDVERVARHLSQGADPSTHDERRRSALHYAASSPSGDLCRLLVGAGADPNARDDSGGSPLHRAAMGGSAEVCLALVSVGADPDALDDAGNTPLALAKNDDAYFVLIGARGGRSGAVRTAEASPAARSKIVPRAGDLFSVGAGTPAAAEAKSVAVSVQVFSKDAADAVAAWAKTYPGDNKSLLERCGKEMAGRGGSRDAVAPARPEKVLELLSSFPCFAGPIRDAAAAMAMQARAAEAGRSRPAKLPNMLLVGGPGIGKTCFVQALGAALALPTETVRMNTSSGGFELCGLDSTWSGSKPGRIFEILARGKCANPIIELDEVDKSGSQGSRLGGSSEAPLFALLEADSARRWRDAFVDQEFDASFPSIVATANSLEGLSEPILSRFEIHEIPDPDEEQRRALALLVWAKALSEEGLDGLFPAHPGEAALARLASMSPRAARRAAGRALGQACVEGRDELRASDFGEASAPARRIGFAFGGAGQ